jgi:predicted metalloprotease
MRWEDGRRSDNVEDRRGGGFSPGMIIGGGGIGTIVLVLVAMFFGIDPSALLEIGSQLNPPASAPESRVPGPPSAPPERGSVPDFVSVVLADTEDTWGEVFRQAGRSYVPPKLVLFTGQVRSACGGAAAAMGPFYCPGDQKVYLDLSFFDELRARFRAPGDFAQAYVIAHEVGHHVQQLLGISEKVQSARQQASRSEANALSVRVELQADCFAGLWAHRADRSRHILESGDIEEGLNAASAIGDDRIQKQAQGYVVPESFTHGSAAQRVRWFRRGLEKGQPNECDTFKAAAL